LILLVGVTERSRGVAVLTLFAGDNARPWAPAVFVLRVGDRARPLVTLYDEADRALVLFAGEKDRSRCVGSRNDAFGDLGDARLMREGDLDGAFPVKTLLIEVFIFLLLIEPMLERDDGRAFRLFFG